jgi:4'-phosphopantetheinyl transferase
VRGADPDVHFSLARCGPLAILALAAAPVGADLEARAFRHPDSSLDGMIRRLHPAERAVFAKLRPERREEAFLSCWVRKEAYLKGIGTGLPGGLAAHCVGLAPEFIPPGGSRLATVRGWSFIDLDVQPGHRAALALATTRDRDDGHHAGPPRTEVRTLHFD